MSLSDSLLLADEPAPAQWVNAGGRAPFLLLGDHAGNAIPRALGTLGLSGQDRERHIAWDIGVHALGIALAEALDAPFLFQPYSRLVIDCNRDPAHPEAAPAMSDGSAIPGNRRLQARDLAARIAAIHAPYHAEIAAEIVRRGAAARPTILLALHSFTPALGGRARPWHAGVLYDRGDTRFAEALLAGLRAQADLVVGDNEPYRMDATDFSVPHHAYPAGLPYAEIEVRQDGLEMPAGVERWCEMLRRACTAALPSVIA